MNNTKKGARLCINFENKQLGCIKSPVYLSFSLWMRLDFPESTYIDRSKFYFASDNLDQFLKNILESSDGILIETENTMTITNPNWYQHFDLRRDTDINYAKKLPIVIDKTYNEIIQIAQISKCKHQKKDNSRSNR